MSQKEIKLWEKKLKFKEEKSQKVLKKNHIFKRIK